MPASASRSLYGSSRPAALIAVMDHAVGLALLQRHVQRSKHELG